MMKKILIASSLVVAFMLAVIAACSPQPAPDKPTPTAAPAVRRTFGGETIIAEGRVLPIKSTALSFPIGGVITEVPVEIGQHVKAGQILAQLDTRQYEAQLAQADANLAAAQAQLNHRTSPSEAEKIAAEQNVAAAQAIYDQLKAGGDPADISAAQAALAAVQQNYAQVKAGPTTQELAKLQAQMENAQASVAQAQAAYDAIGGGDNPQIAMTPQAAALQQATNNFKAAEAAYNEARSHPTPTELAVALSRVREAQAALDRLTPDEAQLAQALSALQTAKAQMEKLQPSAEERAALDAGVKAAQAARDLAAAQLANAKLAAPFAGMVTTVDVDLGQYAAPGMVVVRLADTSAWQIVTTDLTELNIIQVAEGTPVAITFDAIPELQLQGKVTRISAYGESRQGDIVYTVYVTPDAPDARLRWNMTAKVSIQGQ